MVLLIGHNYINQTGIGHSNINQTGILIQQIINVSVHISNHELVSTRKPQPQK